MAVLFLDIGKSAGWCVERRDGRLVHDTWKLPDRPAERFFQWRRNLSDLKARFELEQDPIVQVVYESVDFFPSKNGVYAAHCYGGAWALLLVWCFQNNIPCRGIPVATIKMHLTGKATAAKELVTAEVKRRGYVFKSHDEADAIAQYITVGDKFKPVHAETA